MGDGEEVPPAPPRPRWLDWVEKNSQPKRLKIVRPKRELTPWQKRGPMRGRDWVRFYKWAAKNAVALHMLKKPKPQPKLSPKEERALRAKEKKIPFAEKFQRMPTLAEPRNPRDKYVYPYMPDFPYIPHIRYKEMPPLQEKGRPHIMARVPKDFQHIELETEYWVNLRFPIHPATKKYKASPNIKKLAVPRITPPLVPHCPIPEKPPEKAPKRRKFTPRQWRQHKAKLIAYLARPRQDYYGWT